jgi:hemerythrin-like domain-containing protein
MDRGSETELEAAMTVHDSVGVRETRLVHEVHRRATSLLTEVVTRPGPTAAAYRDFVAAMLEHHHSCEDRDLWPMLLAAAPHLEGALHELTDEHDVLQDRLDELRALPLGTGGSDGAIESVAAALRDLVHEHLSHEEPVLFPALDRYMSEAEWDGFSMRAVASAPQDELPFLTAWIHEVGPTADVELIFRQVPPEARVGIPDRRAEGERLLSELRAVSAWSEGR